MAIKGNHTAFKEEVVVTVNMTTYRNKPSYMVGGICRKWVEKAKHGWLKQ
nr:hypothetical protein [Candidatus Kuenenia stuttgartiensis]